MLRRVWSGWKKALILIQSETVVGWHRAGFKAYWTWISRHHARPRRKNISPELRQLILRMVAENPTWGAPRIHGEVRMLRFDVSERTVLRWMRKALLAGYYSVPGLQPIAPGQVHFLNALPRRGGHLASRRGRWPGSWVLIRQR